MMKKNFDRCWEFTVKQEGGGRVHTVPDDPGGTTKWGISGYHHPGLDIENLTEDQAKEIAKKEYWDSARCDQREWPLDLLAFDTAFNLGVDDVEAIDRQVMRSNGLNWEGFLLRRVMKHIRVARKLPWKVRAQRWGWMFRCYDLYKVCKDEFFSSCR
jgi:lysozyme family protein